MIYTTGRSREETHEGLPSLHRAHNTGLSFLSKSTNKKRRSSELGRERAFWGTTFHGEVSQEGARGLDCTCSCPLALHFVQILFVVRVYALGVLHPLPHAGLTHASRLGFGACEYHAKSIRKLLLQPSRGREDGWCGGRGGRDACFQRTHFGGQGKAVRRRSRKG